MKLSVGFYNLVHKMAGKEELSNYKKAEVALRRYAENTAREITELRKKLI